MGTCRNYTCDAPQIGLIAQRSASFRQALRNNGDPIDIADGAGAYHGSGAASVIAAARNNGVGVAGVSWGARIMALRGINEAGSITKADLIRGMNYVIQMRARGVNVRAVNMSFGGPAFQQAEKDAIDALADAGVIAVCIAHNHSENIEEKPNYPASLSSPNIIAVAASDQLDRLASCSSYGPVSVDLAAPGMTIFFAWAPGISNYSRGNGTSFAAPRVAGAVALLAGARPDWTVAQLKAAILDSADVIPELQGKVLTGGR